MPLTYEYGTLLVPTEITGVADSKTITAQPASVTSDTVETGSHVYHIDPVSGSDSNDGQPAPFGTGAWASISKLASTFSAGDIIYLRQGTHAVGATFLDPVSSGTLANPIKVQGYPGETATLDTTGGSFDGDGVGPIRMSNVDYWWFDDLTGVTDYQSFGAMNGTGHKFTRITQPYSTGSGPDNAGYLKINRVEADDWVIEDSVFNGHEATDINSACMYFYETEKLTIKRSIFRHDGGSGAGPVLHYKQPPANLPSTVNEDILIENCLIDSTNSSVSRAALHWAGAGCIFRNCIIIGERSLDNSNTGSGGFGSMRGNIFDHCTFYWTSSADNGVIIRSSSNSGNNGRFNTIKNSLFVNLQLRISEFFGSFDHQTTLDYNCYRAGSTAIKEYGTTYDLSGWVTQYGQDANSVQGTPTFVTTPDRLDASTFALASGSVGYQACADGSDMGADVTTVGPA